MKKKYGAGDIAFEVFLVVFLVIFVIVTLYPVINTLAISFNDGFDTITHRIHFIPHMWTLDNYKAVFAKEGYRQAAIVTAVMINAPKMFGRNSFPSKALNSKV